MNTGSKLSKQALIQYELIKPFLFSISVYFRYNTLCSSFYESHDIQSEFFGPEQYKQFE